MGLNLSNLRIVWTKRKKSMLKLIKHMKASTYLSINSPNLEGHLHYRNP
jgi:hypothetical protein